MIRIVLVASVLLVYLNLRVLAKLSSYSSTYSQQMAILQSTLPMPPKDSTICRTIPGLTKNQILLCNRQPDVTMVALQGLQDALSECEHQFQGNRWNCSSLAHKQNIYASSLLQKGYRETAFTYALSAAGATIAVARACSQGRLINCACDHRNYRMKISSEAPWKWGGCSHNLQFGIKFTKALLDNRDNASDLQSRVNSHNNQVGRVAVANNMQVQCKCHGMSGSCQLKTCWRSTPDIRMVGKVLKERFRTAVLVDQNNTGDDKAETFKVIKTSRKKRVKMRNKKEWIVRNGNQHISKEKNKRSLSFDLLYYQKSPNFCDFDASLEVPGTSGRECIRNSTGQDNCSSLCCGRGYNYVRQRRTERCNCKFIWCCKVECDTCVVEEWKSICN
ncbi:protein Wnt-10a [Atheta coriaria]|uniref:protein Wnt-10a n=1 Tax=Dalotia coriaria TaxID=877792 RepID=UPI0031F36DF8